MRTLHDHFAAAATQYPSRTAVVYDDGSGRSAETYLQLSRRSEELAQFIAAHGVSRATIACLCESSSASVVSVILGVLKSSCAFVFVRPECPKNYLQSLVNESGPLYLLGEKSLYKKCTSAGADQWKVLGALWDDLFILASYCDNTSERLEKWSSLLEPQMAYIMFTSGTTGEPKVVQVPHQCALKNVLHLRSIFKICEEDVIFQAAPLTFDPSVIEIFLALTTGAQLVLTSGAVKQIPRAVTQLLVDNLVTVIQATPSFIRSLGVDRIKNSLLSKNSCLRILAFGGEECPSADCINSWKHLENSTEIYNLYGITEVSCWATWHKIGPADNGGVPLGAPLDGTVLEVRDDSGAVVEKGDGTLFIGGSLRRCLIGSEKWEDLDACQMRDSGDIVRKSSAGLMFLGRRDSIFKYHGKKINPTSLARRLIGTQMVESCHCHFAATEQLLYFFVILHSGCKAETVVPQLRQQMVGECQCPFRIEAVHGWPLTNHGKVDIKALLTYHRKRRKQEHGSDPVKLLARLWNTSLAQKEDAFVPGDSTFVPAGGNSLTAVSISQELEFALGRPLPLLVDKILNDSFEDIRAYLDGVFQKHGPPVHSVPKRPKVGPGAVPTTVHHLVPVQATTCFTCVSRFDTWQHCSCAQECFKPRRKQHHVLGSLKLSEKWKFDLGKCIDASPLIVNYERGDMVVFIGSHAGRFCALSQDSGKCFWEIRVPDRIESSAGLSSCGRYVAFGCYDHCIYCADVVDGTVKWTVTTGAEVKSSPAANRVNASFVCGSHDKCLYCVRQDSGDLLWKQSLSEGSVFASPAISYKPYQIYAATLDGLVAALSPETGVILWTCKLENPIFSSPVVCGNAVGVCCAGGRICLLDQSSGSKLWITEAGGPIFSTLSQTASAEGPTLVVGCHDRHVYKLSAKDGRILWRTCMDSPVYSTVCCPSDRDICVGAVTQGGLFIVHCQSGKVLSLYYFDNEVFSSPVMFEDFIIVGCRDNYAYCLFLTSEC